MRGEMRESEELEYYKNRCVELEAQLARQAPQTTQVNVNVSSKKTSCPRCGEEMAVGEAPHPFVVRVVRANYRFAGARSGETVEVDLKHINHKSTVLATMSLEEDAASRAPKPKVETSKVGSVDLVRRFTEMAKADNERLIRIGKEDAARVAAANGSAQ